MPRCNRQGPLGQGPMTGRGLGPCGCAVTKGNYFSGGRHMGEGYGMHIGRNFNRFSYQPELTMEQQKELLSEKKAILENEIANLQKNLDEL